MKRSSERILTTHCGSLPRPTALVALLAARDLDEAYDDAELESTIRDSVTSVLRSQADVGIDVVNDGEHSKRSFSITPRRDSAE
jgi:5-methyltetrahydropteroyltriglutamate--homocysteine methyltransferase